MSHLGVLVGRLVRAGTLLLCAALAAGMLRPPDGEGRRRSCLRGHVALVVASESIRVVRVTAHPRPRFVRDRYLACHRRDGRRFEVADGLSVEDEGPFTARLRIVADRYVGVVTEDVGAAATAVRAYVWDADRRRRLHTSRRCSPFFAPGPLEAAFLPGGGLVYSCGALFLVDADGERQLEPPDAEVHDLAVSDGVGYPPRLQWLIGSRATPGAEQQRSLQLSP